MTKTTTELQPQHLRAIYGAAREHQVDNERLHDIIQLDFGKTSVKELTLGEFRRLMDGLRGRTERAPARSQQTSERRYAMATHGRKQ